MENEIINFADFVMMAGDKIVTTSQKVADHFGRQHHHVVQKIKRLGCSAQFLTSNFVRVEYDHRGNKYTAYQMTKDGFMMLVMGFTGAKAMAIKEWYIAAFNAMAEHIKTEASAIWAQYRAVAIEAAKGKDTASLCGRGLNHWKRLKPGLFARLDDLERQLQLPLSLT